jgi:D-alanyl-D-alanine carboxypeptidase
MNAKAKLLQLSTTRFINETGLDVDNKTPGAVGSALDVSKLMLSILTKKPELLSATRKEKIEVQSGSLISHNASNTNEKLNRIQNLIASKTGFTDLAGGNLTIAFSVPVQEIEHVIVLVVLGSTLEGRFTDTETLSSATQLYLTKQ